MSLRPFEKCQNILGDLEKNIKLAKKNLEPCRKLEINRRNIAQEEILKYKLEKLEARRELYWRQRAQTHWLKNGDRNTKFYHAFASERRRRNRIKKLVRDDGGIVEDEQEIHNLITNFYKDLFCSCAGNRYDELLSQVEPKVTPLMNQILMKEFTDDEIKAALDSMGDLKAPGMDGMPALFFKQYWDTVGADVTREVKKLLQGGEMQKG